MIKRGSGLDMEKQQENQVCGSSEILFNVHFLKGVELNPSAMHPELIKNLKFPVIGPH